jgi:membrane-associated phospholipid phosphatase
VIAVAIVIGVSGALAAAAAAITASSRWHADPVDPEIEQREVEQIVRRSRLLRRLRTPLDRWSAGTLVIASALVVVLAVSVIVGLLLDMIDEDAGLARADASVARWGAENATQTSTTVIEAITHLGARPVTIAALALVALFDWSRRHNREVFFFVAAVGLGEMLITNSLKLLVERERPSVMQVVQAHGHSFPSGHTSAATAAWIAVALVLGRNRSRGVRAALSGGAVLIAAAVATSRALLGVHWVTDVVAGLAIGWGWYIVVAVVFGGRRQRLGGPLRTAAPDMVAAHSGDPTAADLRGDARRDSPNASDENATSSGSPTRGQR